MARQFVGDQGLSDNRYVNLTMAEVFAPETSLTNNIQNTGQRLNKYII